MNRAGLVSITFRNKTPREIVALMKRAGLSQVEWGGDVHVKPGAESAAEVRRMTGETEEKRQAREAVR